MRIRDWRSDVCSSDLVRHRWLILIPIAIGVAAAPLLATIIPLRYRSEALILVVPPQVPDSYVKPTVTKTVEDRLPGITAQILSRSRLERIILDMAIGSAPCRTTGGKVG